MKEFTTTINGARWKIRYGNPGARNLGLCDFDKKLITIKSGLTKYEEIGVLLHEILHASYPFLDEHAVENGEYPLVRALHKAGLIEEDD